MNVYLTLYYCNCRAIFISVINVGTGTTGIVILDSNRSFAKTLG